MLDEIAGQAILKISLSPGSCALGRDDKFHLNWIGREKMTKNHGLHQPDIQGRCSNELRLIHHVRQLPMVPVLDGPQTEEKESADGHEHRAQHREQEKDLPPDRLMFMFGHGLEEAVKLAPLLARGMHGVRRVIA
jgi:hypothetical protein